MILFVPGTDETDPKKQNMSLQQIGAAASALQASNTTNTAAIATNTANIATNTANIATNTANIATNTSNIAAHTTAIGKLTNNQFARVQRITTNQSLTSSVATKIQFNSVSFDPSSIWDGTNFRFKPTVPGVYRVSWGVYLSQTAGTPVSYSALYHSGAQAAIGGLIAASPGDFQSNGSDIVYCNGTTHYLEVFGYNTAAVPSAVLGWTHFEIDLVKAD